MEPMGKTAQAGAAAPDDLPQQRFLCASAARWSRVLQHPGGSLDRVDPSETLLRAESTLDFSLPFFLVDPDIANAILASAQFRDRVVILPYRCAPHARSEESKSRPAFRASTRRETNRFSSTMHSRNRGKSLPTNPYTELLVKFIHDARAPNVSERDLPLFLRDGRIARAARMLRSVRGHTRAHVRGRLGLRPYLLERARRR